MSIGGDTAMINKKNLILLSFSKRGDTGGRCTLFYIKGFDSNELFQTNHDSETENMHYRQKFW